MKIKLHIVDDHHMVIEGIRSMLLNDEIIEWKGYSLTANACLSFLSFHPVDVIFMDINLPDRSGIELCKEVTQLYPAVKVIGLSTFGQLSFISKMLDNGADGYLLKNASKEEMLLALISVMQGKKYLSREASDMLKRPSDDAAPTLTRREIEILQLISEGLTNAKIAEKLFVSATTIDTHRKHLLEKFKAKNTAALISLAAKLKIV
ncbi:MAG: response regulator transcription factor [Bacteroidetes bacterium]|nr:response regulator transcription factor [Bacteroidota bacterium]